MPVNENGIFRIIDANLNRSREGLRVCEEITRFILNSSSFTKELKEVRHRITAAGKNVFIDSGSLLGSRDADGDVGRNLVLPVKTGRADYADIFSANIERVKESLRVLEEFSKLTDEGLSRKFSRLRFKVYDIEKKVAGLIRAAKKRRC